MANGNINTMNRNTYNKMKNFFVNSTSLFEKILYIFFAVLFIAIVIYWIIYIYQSYSQNKYFYSLISQYSPINQLNTYKEQKIARSQVGNQLTVSFWLKVNNVDSTRIKDQKNILLIYDDNENDFIQLKLGDGTNITNFTCLMKTSQTNLESCVVNNIPLYTWVNFVYVFNNRTVDVYGNGKLIKSCVMQGIPNYPTSKNYYNVQIGSKTGNRDIDCELFMVQYYGRTLKANEIYNLYNDKPNPQLLVKLTQ
jgi:hypothetical protein